MGEVFSYAVLGLMVLAVLAVIYYVFGSDLRAGAGDPGTDGSMRFALSLCAYTIGCVAVGFWIGRW